jgi:hypothetical protein
MANLDNLLSRLHKVQKRGKDYMACCSAHDDRSPSLTISEKDDGRILIHCFGGCSADEVLSAIGLEMKDLMPENVGYIKKKGERRPFNAMDVLCAVRSDLTYALMVAKDIQRGKRLTPDETLDFARVIGRITMAVQLSGGGK